MGHLDHGTTSCRSICIGGTNYCSVSYGCITIAWNTVALLLYQYWYWLQAFTPSFNLEWTKHPICWGFSCIRIFIVRRVVTQNDTLSGGKDHKSQLHIVVIRMPRIIRLWFAEKFPLYLPQWIDFPRNLPKVCQKPKIGRLSNTLDSSYYALQTWSCPLLHWWLT